MASARVVKSKAPPPPVVSQKERALAAIARMPCFDDYWLEKLETALGESQNPKGGDSDGSIDANFWSLATQLWDNARKVNELRKKFPKPWVAT